MAKLFPETTLTIEGRAYRLVLDVNAQILVESKAGPDATFQSVVEAAMKGRQTASRLLFWGSLQRHHPDITLEAAGDLMSHVDTGASAALREAVTETMPDPADVAELGINHTRPRKAQPLSDGTGGRSRSKHAVAG